MPDRLKDFVLLLRSVEELRVYKPIGMLPIHINL